MKVVRLSDAERDVFVGERRLGILSTLHPDGAPFALPLWFGWDGTEVEMFSMRSAPKVTRLQHDPRSSLLVANHPDETARWVLFEGDATISEDGASAAAARLYDRYHPDATEKQRARTLASFDAADIVRVAIAPTRVVTYAETF